MDTFVETDMYTHFNYLAYKLEVVTIIKAIIVGRKELLVYIIILGHVLINYYYYYREDIVLIKVKSKTKWTS